MLSRLAAIWRVPELLQKILLTIGLLAVYRLGFHISLPFINHDGIRQAQERAAEDFTRSDDALYARAATVVRARAR